ncbi:hypothetical protein [Novosphingobium sp.]|uniref:hypothetical protein n=1 Tax=Novosphingobium sp. TaxID=1874826 RepID=UPI0025EB5EFC|nr:hypothetical protein [Novosphingobium sp.]
MPTLAQLLAPLALLLTPSQSAPVDAGDRVDGIEDSAWALALQANGPPLLSSDEDRPGTFDPETWNQVRIEQHLTIRIYPGQLPRGAFIALPPSSAPQRGPDKRQIRCVALSALGGLRLSGANQLMLVLRDDRMVLATLPKICSASSFYSGFYVEPTPDGMLCARRDVIHSRAGANCSISRLDLADPGS